MILLLAISRAEKADCLISLYNGASSGTNAMIEAIELHAAAQDVFRALRTSKLSFQPGIVDSIVLPLTLSRNLFDNFPKLEYLL